MSQIPGTSYEFGPFQLDAVEQLLRHDGREIALTPKAFGVLLLLVRNPGHVLTKDDFMREVWADSVVEEKNLTDNISILRHALGDDPREPKYIRTVPKRGYRFVGEVTTAGNGVELLLAEHTRARVVIEEQHELPVVAAQKQSEGRRFSAKAVALFSTVGVIAVAAAGIVWYRQQHRPAALPIVLSPAHLVPLTSFPDEEVSPALSPDGKFVAYSWKGGTPDRMNIYVQQVDAGTPIRLTTGLGREGDPSWSPDGSYLSFIRGDPDPEKSGLYTIPAFGGHERLLTNRACGADWSPDAKSLVVTISSNPQGDTPALCAPPVGLSVLNMETLETKALTVPPPDSNDSFGKFSPDGKSVAFLRSQEDVSELFVIPSQGGEARQLTFDKRRLSGVAWTADSHEIVFSSNRSGIYCLWRIAREGGTPMLVEGSVQDAQEPSVARLGGRLAYSQQAVDTNVWRLSANDPRIEPVRLISSTRRDEHPHLSPDGQKIVFESNRSGSREIWSCKIDGSDQNQLTAFNGPYTGNPRWSPDGRQIAFDSRPEGHPHIYLISAEGGQPRQLTNGESNEVAPTWSRNGEWIYFASNRGGKWQIWKISTAGGDPVQVTRDGGYEVIEADDGKSLYYNKHGLGAVGLYQSSLDGASERRILELPQLMSLGDWLSNPEGIYFVERYEGPGKPASPVTIKFFDFETGQKKVIATLPHDPTSNPGLNLTPDRKWLIYSIDDYRTFDIMLVDNFH